MTSTNGNIKSKLTPLRGGCDCDGSGRGWCADVSARMEAARRWRRRDASKDERRGKT